ncbi:MAG: hypothetical protein J0665_01130 [Deltaproteobacteria bacterium]|nr:hypothetical protein [Deltaproteobacteria bacterium]
MGTPIVQSSFTSGELSPSLYGRVDFNRYYTGLRTCRNFLIRQFGGVSNRPGTRMICPTKYPNKATRLTEFEFSTTQTYVLEFGDYYMRVIKDGGQVLTDAGAIYELATIYPAADLALLKTVQSADVMTICHPNYPPQQLSRTGHNIWSLAPFDNLQGPFQDINVVSTKTVYVNAVTGNTTVTASEAIFTADMVGQMMYIEQSPDSLIRKWEVQKTMVLNEVRRAGSHYYKVVVAGTTGTVRPDHEEGIGYDGDPGVGWKYLHSGYGILLITGFTSTTVVTGTVLKQLPDQVLSGAATKAIGTLTPGDPGSPDPSVAATPVTIIIAGHGYVSGESVTLSGITGTVGANGTWPITVLDVDTFTIDCYATEAWGATGFCTKVQTALPSYKWAIEAWGGNKEYPGTTCYFNQRQFFGGSVAQPQTFWASQVSGFTSFATSIPLLDDDALTYSLNSRRVNQIRHFVELSKLIMLTSDGPFILDGGSDGVLAPGKMSTKRQGASGSAHLEPIIVGTHALYLQEKGSQVRSLGYSFADDAFIGQDLTIMSSHLFYRHSIVDWAFQTVPFSTAWVVRNDGALLSLTYMPEQEVIGWARHDTAGKFESTACITENNEDAVYFTVERTINGATVKFIERMSTRFFQTIKDAFFVDCGLSYDGRNETATTVTVAGTTWDYTDTVTISASSAIFAATDIGDEIIFYDEVTAIAYRMRINAYTDSTHVSAVLNKTLPTAYRATARADWTFARNTMSGLNHLEGETVNILADGNVVEPKVVVNGTITLPYPAGVVHIGLPIESDLETLDITTASQSLREKQKLINHVSLVVEESTGIWCGPDADHLTEYKQRSDENYDENQRLAAGLIDLRIQATWNKNGRVFVRQNNPLPITILAALPEVNLGGS